MRYPVEAHRLALQNLSFIPLSYFVMSTFVYVALTTLNTGSVSTIILVLYQTCEIQNMED